MATGGLGLGSSSVDGGATSALADQLGQVTLGPSPLPTSSRKYSLRDLDVRETIGERYLPSPPTPSHTHTLHITSQVQGLLVE